MNFDNNVLDFDKQFVTVWETMIMLNVIFNYKFSGNYAKTFLVVPLYLL